MSRIGYYGLRGRTERALLRDSLSVGVVRPAGSHQNNTILLLLQRMWGDSRGTAPRPQALTRCPLAGPLGVKGGGWGSPAPRPMMARSKPSGEVAAFGLRRREGALDLLVRPPPWKIPARAEGWDFACVL